MSCVLPNNMPSPDPGKEKSVLWVQCYYFYLTPHTLRNMKYNAVWTSKAIDPDFFNFSLEFQFQKGIKNDFIFTCIRTPVSPSSDDHTLQIYCSFNVFDKDLNVLVLHSDKYKVAQKYDLNTSFRKCLTPSAYTTALELKVLVKMIEYNCCISSPAYNQQEKEFRKLKEEYFNDETVLQELCYILDIPRVQDIFTGRQKKVFAALKRTYIARTSTFSREIAKYKNAKYRKTKDPLTPLPVINLAFILNYILTGEHLLISDADLFRVYNEGYRMGLNFLVELSRDSMLGRVENHNFRLEAFQAADFVGDTILFDKIIDIFYSSGAKILNERILEERKKTGMQWRFMAQVLERRLRERNKNHVETGNHQSTSTVTYPLQNDSPTSTVTLRND